MILLFLLGLTVMGHGDDQGEPWVEPFAIEWGLEEPEDVHFPDASSVGYVSNINGESTALDGNGYISRIDAEGVILERRWLSGLDGPKGMRDDGQYLYVADIHAVVQVEIQSAQIADRFDGLADTIRQAIVRDNRRWSQTSSLTTETNVLKNWQPCGR